MISIILQTKYFFYELCRVKKTFQEEGLSKVEASCSKYSLHIL